MPDLSTLPMPDPASLPVWAAMPDGRHVLDLLDGTVVEHHACRLSWRQDPATGGDLDPGVWHCTLRFGDGTPCRNAWRSDQVPDRPIGQWSYRREDGQHVR